jgi:hypothetical protein
VIAGLIMTVVALAAAIVLLPVDGTDPGGY